MNSETVRINILWISPSAKFVSA